MQVLSLVKGSAGYIKTEKDWRMVLAILHMTAMDPSEQAIAMEALLHIVTDPSMHPSAFRPCFDAILQFLERARQVSSHDRISKIYSGFGRAFSTIRMVQM